MLGDVLTRCARAVCVSGVGRAALVCRAKDPGIIW